MVQAQCIFEDLNQDVKLTGVKKFYIFTNKDNWFGLWQLDHLKLLFWGINCP